MEKLIHESSSIIDSIDEEVFEKNEIKIKTSLDPLIIKGNSFEILYIATSTLIISGYFDYIGYGE